MSDVEPAPGQKVFFEWVMVEKGPKAVSIYLEADVLTCIDALAQVGARYLRHHENKTRAS